MLFSTSSYLVAWASLGSAHAFKVLQGIGRSPRPSALSGIRTNLFEGHQQTTFDVTNHTTWDDLIRVIPHIGDASKLFPDTAPDPVTYSVAYAVLSGKASKSSNRHNALIPVKKEFANNRMYQIRYAKVPGEETDPSFGVGISSTQAFAAGWAMKGVLLGTEGNLQSGKRALKTSFTPPIEAGQIIDWFVEIQNHTQVDIFIAIDNVSFGHAFSLDFSRQFSSTRNDLEDIEGDFVEELRPIVSFSETADKTAVATVVYEGLPLPVRAKYRARSSSGYGDKDAIVGEWINDDGVKLEITKNKNDAYSVKGRVVNIINFEMNVDHETGEVTWKSQGISTRMMGPEHLMEVERNYLDLISCLTQVRFADQELTNDLVFTCLPIGEKRKKNSKYPEMTFYRSRKMKPATRNPFIAY